MHLTKNTFLKTINNRILLFLLSILVCYFSIISIEYFDSNMTGVVKVSPYIFVYYFLLFILLITIIRIIRTWYFKRKYPFMDSNHPSSWQAWKVLPYWIHILLNVVISFIFFEAYYPKFGVRDFQVIEEKIEIYKKIQENKNLSDGEKEIAQSDFKLMIQYYKPRYYSLIDHSVFSVHPNNQNLIKIMGEYPSSKMRSILWYYANLNLSDFNNDDRRYFKSKLTSMYNNKVVNIASANDKMFDANVKNGFLASPSQTFNNCESCRLTFYKPHMKMLSTLLDKEPQEIYENYKKLLKSKIDKSDEEFYSNYQKLKLTAQRNKEFNKMKPSEKIGHTFGTISESVGDSWDAAIGDKVDEFKKGFNKAKEPKD